jgi:hypothetical protein
VLAKLMHRTRWLLILPLFLGAVFLVGCAGTVVKPPSGMIGGIPAPKSKVVVRQQQELKVNMNVSWILPAGDYRPSVEDETGIYYEAPSKVIMNEVFLGMHLKGRPFDGGIFLARSNPQVAKIYFVVPTNEGGEILRWLKGGRPDKPMTPRQPIQFQLIRL